MIFGLPKGVTVVSWMGHEYYPDIHGNISVPISDPPTLMQLERRCNLLRGGHPVPKSELKKDEPAEKKVETKTSEPSSQKTQRTRGRSLDEKFFGGEDKG